MAKIRVPAGVVVDGQAWGGRFVSVDRLIDIAAATDTRGLQAIERLAEREQRKAAAKHQRAANKYVDDPQRWRERRRERQQEQHLWEIVRDAAQDFAKPPKKSKTAKGQRAAGKPAAKRGVRRDRPTRAPRKRARGKRVTEPREPTSVEWEIGFKYRAESRGRRSSDVDVNLRIRRTSGRPFDVAQARKVLSHVRRHQETPDGFLVAGVDWKRPHAGSGWRHGDVSDMENFWAPMYSRDTDASAWDIRAQDFRFGAIKPTEEDDDAEG